MVDLLDRVVMAIGRARGEPPRWAFPLFRLLHDIHRKVTLSMAVDTQVVARLVAAAGAVAEQAKKVAVERDAYKQLAEQEGLDLDAARQRIQELQDAEAAEDVQDAA